MHKLIIHNKKLFIHKIKKRITASLIAVVVISELTPINIKASELEIKSEGNITTEKQQTYIHQENREHKEIKLGELIETSNTQIESEDNIGIDINDQLDELYEQVADYLDIDKLYVKELHLLAGGKAEYADKIPNIYNTETVKALDEPMKIKGANTNYQMAEFIECEDPTIERPSGYYLPDAVYSVAYDIAALMNQRYHYNRGGMQPYFNSLKEYTQKNIIFYESVMLYTGEKEETVNNFYKAYEKLLYDKQSDENIVIEEKENSELAIKEKFKTTLKDIGITNENTLHNLALMLSFDKELALNDNDEVLKDEYIVPYKLNYTSRENMMIAAMCLVGKVRYVWAGGHSGASYIDGINPIWEKWNNLYPDEEYTIVDKDSEENTNENTNLDENTSTDENLEKQKNEGFDTCIKPSGSWCPLHGYSRGECSKGKRVYSLDEYVESRAEAFNNDELLEDKYREMLSKVDYSNGISIHTLDGLDCSGFASWLYNQITDKYEINSVARNFSKQYGLKEVTFGSKLLPGDIFCWTSHIVVIIGQFKENSKVYLTVEETPMQLKFGVVYYTGAPQSEIDEAIQLAAEANELIGGISESEKDEPHVYHMNACGFYNERMKLSEAQADPNVIKITKIDGQPTVAKEATKDDENTDDTDSDTRDMNNTNDAEENSDIESEETIPAMNNTSASTEDEELETDENTDNTASTADTSAEDGVQVAEEEDQADPMCTVLKQQRSIGRFRDTFIDEDTIIPEYDKTIKDMYAQEIIQYTLEKLPISYILGYNKYEGQLLNKEKASSTVGLTSGIDE